MTMYVNKLKALDAIREPDTIRSLIGELNMYSALLKSVPDGQEGLGSGLPKILIGVVDVFLRIGNTFKTNVLKFHKRLKRGEMRYFTESNRLKVAKVEDTPYARFIKLRLNAPSGMTGFYMDAVSNITKTYEQLALKDTIVPLVDKLTQVQRMLVNSDASVSTMVSDLMRISSDRTKLMDKTLAENKKIFTDKSTAPLKEFPKLYATMEDFKIVRSRLTELETELNRTANVIDVLTGADEKLVFLIEYLESNHKTIGITKRFIDDLIHVIRYVGEGFETQGRTTMQQMSLEHNHVLNISAMYKVS